MRAGRLPLGSVLLASLVCLLPLLVTAGYIKNSVLRREDPDFMQLVKYANLASVAYCVSELQVGTIGGQPKNCPSTPCFYPPIAELDIVEVFDFIGWFDVGSGYVAVDHTSETVYLSFRGTKSRQDWINNLIWLPVKYTPLVEENGYQLQLRLRCKGCYVHKGFNAFVKTNVAVIVKRVIQLMEQNKDYRLRVTGHSLGAAVAIFCGIELRLLGYDTLVTTMGGPKVGNTQFCNFVDRLFETDNVVRHIGETHSFDDLDVGLIRMYHIHDIVPLLPPTSQYQHSGYEYYLSAEGLDQPPEMVIRKGRAYVEKSDEAAYRDLLPGGFNRNDHTYYFIHVTLCGDD